MEKEIKEKEGVMMAKIYGQKIVHCKTNVYSK